MEKIGHQHNNLFRMVKDVVGDEFMVRYSSVEGAVAVLRQLGCGLHLESERELYFKIRQYIGRIWLVG